MHGPNEAAWKDWSAKNRERLVALPRAALLTAVQLGALDNLTPEDAKVVLSDLAGFESSLPKIRLMKNGRIKTTLTTGRTPDPFTGRGLQIRPKIWRLRLIKHAGLFALASAALLWMLVFLIGQYLILYHDTMDFVQ